LLLPFIKWEFDLSLAAAAVLVTIFAVGRAIGSLPTGYLVDRLGSRSILIWTCYLLAVFLGLAATTHTILWLVLALIAAGAATAGTTAAGAPMVAAAYTKLRGLAMGIRQAGIPIGGAVGALALPWLAYQGSWRLALAGAGAVALAGAVVASLMRRDPVARVSARDAVVGHRPPALLSAPLVVLFIWSALAVAAQYAFLALISVQEGAIGLGVTMVVLSQAGGVVGRPGWGLVSDAIGRRRRLTLLIVTAVGISSILAISWLPPASSVLVLGAAAVGFGLSINGWQGIWVTSVVEIAGPARAGTALGYGQLALQIGTVAGPAFVALVAENTGGFGVAWPLLAGAMAVASVPLVILRSWPAEGRYDTSYPDRVTFPADDQ
jgi:MFS family permease